MHALGWGILWYPYLKNLIIRKRYEGAWRTSSDDIIICDGNLQILHHMEKIVLYTCFIIAVISVSINPSMSLSTLIQQHIKDKRYLPQNRNKPIIIGYDHNAKSGKAERAIKTDGANIIIWSFLHLHDDDDDDTKKIKTALDLGEIRSIRDKYEHVM